MKLLFSAEQIEEYVYVGTGIGSGIMNMHELKVMSYHEAMAALDKKEWEASVQHEHDRMVKYE